MTSPLRASRAAFVFLTRIPVGGFPYVAEEWRWASAYFPLVGAVVGAFTSGVFHLLRPIGALAAAFLALGSSLLATGALHEDGLADTADALGGGQDKEKVFAILKDSRVGVFGACALVVSIGGRAALLAQLHAGALAPLVFVGAVARAAPVWQMVALPYATPGAAKSREVARAGPAQAVVASFWALLIGALCVTCAPRRGLARSRRSPRGGGGHGADRVEVREARGGDYRRLSRRHRADLRARRPGSHGLGPSIERRRAECRRGVQPAEALSRSARRAWDRQRPFPSFFRESGLSVD